MVEEEEEVMGGFGARGRRATSGCAMGFGLTGAGAVELSEGLAGATLSAAGEELWSGERGEGSAGSGCAGGGARGIVVDVVVAASRCSEAWPRVVGPAAPPAACEFPSTSKKEKEMGRRITNSIYLSLWGSRHWHDSVSATGSSGGGSSSSSF